MGGNDKAKRIILSCIKKNQNPEKISELLFGCFVNNSFELAKLNMIMAYEAEREHEQKHEHYPNCDKGGVLPPLKKGELIFV